MPRKTKRTKKVTYRPVQIGKRLYKTSSSAVRYYLKRTKLTQAKIAERCQVTPACVSQLASEIRQ
jgi:hypothetical protein